MKFSTQADKAIKTAKKISKELGHGYVGTEHLLYGLLKAEDSIAYHVLNEESISDKDVLDLISELMHSEGSTAVKDRDGYTPKLTMLFNLAEDQARISNSEEIGTEHLLLAMFQCRDCAALRILNSFGANEGRIFQGLISSMGENGKKYSKALASVLQNKNQGGEASLLAQFSRDMTEPSVAPLSDVPEFTSLLIKFRNPFIGMLAGMLLTAIIQSSSASVGILQALCSTGAVSYSVALPIIMGQNIGTCVTTLISAVGAKKNAKRAAFIHLYFNVVGTLVFMIGFYALNAVMNFAFFDQSANAFGIALTHSCFNVIATVIWIPFHKLLVKLASATVKGQDPDDESQFTKELAMLDERFFERPTFAVAQTVNVANKMADLARECLILSGDVIKGKYNQDKIDKVIALERAVDKYEDKLGTYLVQLSSKPLNQADSETITEIFQCIGSFERISDHARNMIEVKEIMQEKELVFTDKANSEIEKYVTAVQDIVDMTIKAYIARDDNELRKVEAFEEAIDNIDRKAKKHHIKRLQKGKCAIANSIVIEDLYINLERVADHCSNVAATMIQVNEDDALENHVFVNALKAEEQGEFKAAVKEYTKKYSI